MRFRQYKGSWRGAIDKKVPKNTNDIYESKNKWEKENSLLLVDGELYKTEEVRKTVRTLELREIAKRIAKED